MTPVIGQGCNSALEDCEVLDSILESTGACLLFRALLSLLMCAATKPAAADLCTSAQAAVHSARARTVLCGTNAVCMQAGVPCSAGHAVADETEGSQAQLRVGDAPAAAAEAWTRRRLPDAHSLSNIEGAVYKVVGGRKLGFLDPTFLSIVAHLAIGAKAPAAVLCVPAMPPLSSCTFQRHCCCCCRCRCCSAGCCLVVTCLLCAGTLRHKLLPFWFGPPALSKLDTTLPYSTIESSIRRDASVVAAALASAAVFLLLKLFRVL